jgi:hypothetical protein
MSTRCNIHFTDSRGGVEANIYRHSDGYPDGVLPDLDRFFAAVEAQTSDTRFNDPSYLAAKFVVWQAGEYAHGGQPLDFISLGIMGADAGDGEFVYTVTCSDGYPPKRPAVTYREA